MVYCFEIKNPIVSVLVCLFISTPTPGQKLPNQCKVWLPEYIANTNQVQPEWTKSQDWQDWVITKIKNNEFGTANSLVWKVYSDRVNNKTYIEPNETSAGHSTLGFMEEVDIAEIRNGFALLYKSYSRGEGLEMPKDAQCFGWIPIDNLLLWKESLRTYSKIYQKALVIHDPIKYNSIVEKNPSFFLEPDKTTEVNQRAKDLDIYFVMKTAKVGSTKYYLLSRSVVINNTQTVCGWMPEELVTEWNLRLLIEPTYRSKVVEHYKSKKIYPCVFYEMDDARQLWTNEVIQNPLWKYSDFDTKRMCEYVMRFPILNEVAAGIYRVACIASLHSDIDNKIEDFIEALKVNSNAKNLERLLTTMKGSSLQKRKLTEIFKSYNWSETDIDKYMAYLKGGGNATFTGYAPVKTSKSEEQLFDFVLFFSQSELLEVIQQLTRAKLISLDAVYDAQAFQNKIVKLGQAMLGQFNEDEIRNMDMDRLLGQIYGIPVPLNLCGLDIKKIPNMDEENLRDYITVFKNKLNKLIQILSDTHYDGRFQRNRIPYYWIPMEDMPGVYDDCNKLKIKN